MEELNKTQIILLTLFVSFITSIATGITTVTLMDQAPPAITQTLNRVVEKTIERVIQPASVVTKEVKVVVKETDLIVKAVDKNVSRVATITALKNIKNAVDGEKQEILKDGIGFLVSKDGYVIVDSELLYENTSSYRVRFTDGSSFNADVATTSASMALLYLRNAEQMPAEIKTDGQKILDSVKQAVGIQTVSLFAPVSFGNMSAVKLGQSVVALGGKTGDEVSVGIISRIEKTIENDETIAVKNDKNNPPQDAIAKKENASRAISGISAIYTNVMLAQESSGGPLITTDGDVIGMNIVRGNASFAIPANLISELLNSILIDSADINTQIK